LTTRSSRSEYGLSIRKLGRDPPLHRLSQLASAQNLFARASDGAVHIFYRPAGLAVFCLAASSSDAGYLTLFGTVLLAVEAARL
jgi:hypothetical protein